MEKNDVRRHMKRHILMADDVIDGFWETVLERIGNSRTIVAKGYDTQVSKLFKFFNLGVSAKTSTLTSHSSRTVENQTMVLF